MDTEYGGSFALPIQGFSANVTYGYEEYNWNTLSFHDGGGSLKTSMTDSTGTSRYYYDIQGRLSRYVPSVRNPGDDSYPYVISYEYNNLGQKTTMKIGAVSGQCSAADPFKYATCELTNVVYDAEYAYYANGWLKSVKSGASDVADYTYDVVGNRTQVDLGNGTYTVYAYDTDPRYRLTTITHKNSSNATLATIDYTSTARDKVGNPKSMTDWTGTWAYGYDDMNRLTSATAPAPVPGQPAGGSGALAYGYDWVGNRIHPPSDPNAMVYNTADQLTSWPGMRQYTYYPDGSLHHVLNAGGTSTLASYAYTPTGLLATATYNGRTLTNTWDANANRVTLTSPGATYDLKREFVYDPTAGIPAVVQETQVNDPDEPDDDVHVYYFREPGGSLISRLEGANTSYYHFDALGSTRLLTTGVGENVVVTDKYAYDAYGALISHDRLSGSIDQPYQYVGRLGYYTHWMEPEFGLLQLGVRFYDPEVGRFTQRDAVRRAQVSNYTYADGKPCVLTDPTGRIPNIQCTKQDDPDGKVKYAITRICNSLVSGGMNNCGGNNCNRRSPGQLRCLKNFCSHGTIVCNGGYVGVNCGVQVDDSNIEIGMPQATSSSCDCDKGPSTGQPLHVTILHEMMHACGTDVDDNNNPNSADNKACDCVRKALK